MNKVVITMVIPLGKFSCEFSGQTRFKRLSTKNFQKKLNFQKSNPEASKIELNANKKSFFVMSEFV